MRKLLLILAALTLVAVLPADRGTAYPKIEDGEADRWTLDIQFRPMRMISVIDHGGKRALYWYVLYTVTNDTDHESVRFNPDFKLLTDANKIYRDVLDMGAFDAIKRRHKDMMLESPIQIAGPLQRGPGFAKDGVAIFKEVARKTDAFKVFVSGLSDDSRVLNNPVTGKKTNLYKTLERSYRQPGDRVRVNRDQIFFTGQRYIYR